MARCPDPQLTTVGPANAWLLHVNVTMPAANHIIGFVIASLLNRFEFKRGAIDENAVRTKAKRPALNPVVPRRRHEYPL